MKRASDGSGAVRGWIAFVVAALCAALIGVALALQHADRASNPAAVAPVLVAPTTTTSVAYFARPGANGTKVLTETVDPLSLAVPDSWTAPAADPLTLPGVLDQFATQAPALAGVLQDEGQVEQKAAIRLFAYQPASPSAFVSVISFSSPTTKPFTAASIAAIVALAKKKTSSIAVTGVQLAVGDVLQLNSSAVVQNQPVVVEILVLVAAGRTMQIEMVAETNVAQVPPVFAQIEASLRIS